MSKEIIGTTSTTVSTTAVVEYSHMTTKKIFTHTNGDPISFYIVPCKFKKDVSEQVTVSVQYHYHFFQSTR